LEAGGHFLSIMTYVRYSVPVHDAVSLNINRPQLVEKCVPELIILCLEFSAEKLFKDFVTRVRACNLEKYGRGDHGVGI
jgi:hypothetical protein